MSTALIIICSIILFLLVVLVHEFGHFITAKIFGVRVNEFAIGMGPKLFSKQGKETLYSFRLIPIGGFCAMEGEDEDSDDERAFGKKKPWQKFIIVSAGAIFNIILGIIFMIVVQSQVDLVGTTTVWGFPENSISASQESGLMVGDKIVSVDGYKVLCYSDVYYGMGFAGSSDMVFTVIRDGEKQDINVRFNTNQRLSSVFENNDEVIELYQSATDIAAVEFTDGTLREAETISSDFIMVGKEKNFGNVIGSSFSESVSMCRVVYVSFWKLITGQFRMTDLSGPVGIISYIGQAAEAGITEGASFWENFVSSMINIFQVMALITINLGIFNLLPLPALDGGRLIFILIEMIRRKPINPKYESIVHAVGLILLLVLMVVVTFNDVVKLIGCTG